MDNPQHSLDDALVEKVARAIAGVCFETGWDDLAEDTRACFFPYARAALEAAGVAELREENERLRETLTDARNNILSLLGGFRDEMPDSAVKLFQAQARQIDAALNPRQNEEEGE